ncbi:hypothetical protein HY448_02830 [Candidatus Pacearchaeota archaeon]|nr:hypothetical protein [Candidatus Pacearchaeota archaeon]
MNQEIYNKITAKKEFSHLPKKDVEIAFHHFQKRNVGDLEKIKLTRELLHKVFGAFGSRKLLNLKYKSPEWVLKKHLSSRERFTHYKDIYSRILKDEERKLTIIDLGSGVNGFSYNYFKDLGFDVDYLAIESMGQFTDLMNFYFEKNKARARAIHLSLFELEKLKEVISESKKPRIALLLKVVDSLEMIKRDYSKEILSELSKICEKIVVSFATRSMIKRKRFSAKRIWFLNFIKENFEVLDEFSFGDEKFFVFKKNSHIKFIYL